MSATSLVLEKQLPDFVVADYPKFVDFLKAYYNFLDENYRIPVESLRDADNTSDSLIIFLKRELLRNFPNSVIDERKLIQTVRQIYNRKGNMDSIKLLFKLFLNDSIIIKQPGDQILRASDARWVQYNIVSISEIDWDTIVKDINAAAAGDPDKLALFSKVYNTKVVGDINNSGTITSQDAEIIAKFSIGSPDITQEQKDHIEQILIPAIKNDADFYPYVFGLTDIDAIQPEKSKLIIENRFGRFTPTISFFDVDERRRLRVFFKTFNSLKIITGQRLSITDSEGNIAYEGFHKQTPNGLRVLQSGKNWQRGQVIRVPGTLADTIARVTELDSTGGIKQIEILEHGFSHDENQAVIVSPYPVKPTTTFYEGDSTIIGIDPLTYHHTVTIQDYTEGTAEVLYGTKQNDAPVISYSTQETNSVSYNFSELTMAEWLESRATLFFDRADIVKTKGEYLNDFSIISNSLTRLQDNYFYQLYSYLIQTTRSGSEFYHILEQVHPAGMKYFYEQSKLVELSVTDELDSYRSISQDVVYLRDIYFAQFEELFYVNFIKVIEDEDSVFEATDSHIINFIKAVIDSEGFVTAENETEIKDFIKAVIDSEGIALVEDIVAKHFTKVNTTESEEATDVIWNKIFTKIATEVSVTPEESEVRDFTKESTDTIDTSTDSEVRDFTKESIDTTNTPTDSEVRLFDKEVLDPNIPEDSEPIFVSTLVKLETINIEELEEKVGTKYLDTTLSVQNSDGAFVSLDQEEYATAYFAEDYTRIVKQIYIG